MSSPIGHSLAGIAISVWRGKSLKPKSFPVLVLYIFIANVPDLDFIPGIIIGKPNLYHHGISHSLGMAMLVAALVTPLLKRVLKTSLIKEYLFIVSLYLSHLILDLIAYDGRPPYGIPIFWPLSDTYFMLPILPPVKHSKLDHATTAQFFTDVFSVHNLYVMGLELILTLPFILTMTWLFKKKALDA